MGNLPIKLSGSQSTDGAEDKSLLSQITLHFEYNKTIAQVKSEARSRANHSA